MTHALLDLKNGWFICDVCGTLIHSSAALSQLEWSVCDADVRGTLFVTDENGTVWRFEDAPVIVKGVSE